MPQKQNTVLAVKKDFANTSTQTNERLNPQILFPLIFMRES